MIIYHVLNASLTFVWFNMYGNGWKILTALHDKLTLFKKPLNKVKQDMLKVIER